jgi:hypothetical protein
MKVFILVLTLLLPFSQLRAVEARSSIQVTCLMHESGNDQLTEQDFILVDGLDQVVFYEGGVTYTARFAARADFEDKRLAAVTIDMTNPSMNFRTFARTTFKPSEGFSQLRIDVQPADSSKPGPSGFFLCHGKPLR